MARRSCRAGAAKAASGWRSETALLSVERSADAGRPQALPREKRLAKRHEFLRVYETGRRIFSRYSVVFFAANDLPYSRIGITATKKLGKANVRNRIKRWTREIYRHERAPLGLDERALDVVVNVKPNAAQATFREFSDDLSGLLRRVASESRS